MGKQSFVDVNDLDPNDNPIGGYANGIGFRIEWQKGATRGEGAPGENGAFVETILTVCRRRLEFYQETKFNCPENAEAIEHLNAALAALEARTFGREARGVEGTHEV